MTSIKNSILWSALEQTFPQLVRFVVFVVLARLLQPEDFGLIAMLGLFIAVANVFADSGFTAALIQRKNLTADDLTSIYTLNLVVSSLLALLLCAFSPFVAAFFERPILISLLCVSSLALVFASFGMVHSTLLSRRMEFKKAATISSVSVVLGGSVAVILATLNYGVWSLLGLSLTESLVRTMLTRKLSGWRHKGKVNLRSIRDMWGFSSRLLACNLIGVFYQNIYSVIIGKAYSAESLGFFNRANRLRMLPASVISSIVASVSFPLFSRHQENKPYLLDQTRKFVRFSILLSAASLTLLSVIADPLIPILLTEKWNPTIPILQILCIATVTFPIHSLYLMALQAQGHSHLNLRLEVIKLVVGLSSIAVVYRYGILALAFNMLFMSVFAYFLNAWYNVKLLGYKWSYQAFDIIPTVVLCFISAAVSKATEQLAPSHDLLQLGTQTLIFLLVTFAGIVIFRRVYFSDIWEHIMWGYDQLRLVGTNSRAN